VVLLGSFRRIAARGMNSADTKQSGHASRSEPEIKNGESSAKSGVPDRLRCRKIQNEVS